MATILSVSLPPDLPALLDAHAKRHRRSRSFIVTEAIREYLAREERDEFTAARDRTLLEGLALSPSERVQLIEDLWHELTHGRKPTKGWTAAFDTFDEYEEWKRRGGEPVP